MHLIGVLLIAICPALIGNYFAKLLSYRRIALAQSVELVECMKAEIRYSGKEIQQMIHEFGKSSQFQQLPFLKECDQKMDQGEPFPSAWKTALEQSNQHFQQQDLEQIASLGRILGASDVEGQLSSLELISQNLQHYLQQSEEFAHSKGKLYRSLGILTGIAVAILVV
ncbi:stage III sporulation protein AB [Clostridium facile]|uniref:Stage III sporulation protein AB n=1 Tax=Clostridium facile TaxID=2763035 RepID=A0ABR7INA0_9CLOT|nr:stage III sporulation protein AB [Clostridium facile]MBC5786573.1 stage III sporulation protein AB [Clostridium facile]